MGQIVQLTDWEDLQVLTHTALNAEIAQIINTVNALVNENWAGANAATNLDGLKVNIGTNATFLAEHGATGAHAAVAGTDMDTCRVLKNPGTPASKVTIVFDRLTVYDSDTINTRGRKLIQSTGAVTLVADVTASGASGLDTGSEAADTVYAIWVIKGTTTKAMLSTAQTIAALTLPSGYTHAKMVGIVYNNTGGDFEIPRPLVGAGYLTNFFPLFGQFATGTYVGTGSGQAITGVEFDPDYTITQGLLAQVAVHKSIDQVDAKSHTYNGAELASDGITALTADGFTVGSNDLVDKSGETFIWMAWKKSTGVG